MKIVVIDDDPAITELLKIILAQTSFEILTVNSGKEGVDIVKQESPEVVILDLMMPEMNGLEVCARIREFSSVPIIILSALDSPGMVVRSLDSGADDYLVKPVPSGVLIAHVNNLLRRANVNHAINVGVNS